MTTDDRLGNGSHQPVPMNKTNPNREEPGGQSPPHGDYLRSRVLNGQLSSAVIAPASVLNVFWNELREIAHRRGVHLSELVGHIDGERQHCNLSSAIRMFVFEHARGRAESVQNAKSEPDPMARDGGGTILNRNR